MFTLNVPSLKDPQFVTSSGTIQTSVYPYSDSRLSSNGTTGLVWINDNSIRTSINRTTAISSFWNGTTWSVPQPLNDDGKADFHPQIIAFPDGSAIAAWGKEKILQPDDAVFDDIVSNLEISAVRYNPANGQWEGGPFLTSNGYLDRNPRVAGPAVNNVFLSWISNPSNSITGSGSQPNIIYGATYNGTAWSSPFQIAQAAYPILSYDLTYNGTTAYLVLTVDQDSDLTTVNDHELYSVSVTGTVPGSFTRLTNDSVSDDSPHLTKDADGNDIVIWLRGGALVSAPMSGMTNQAVIYTDEYSSNLAAFSLARSSSGRISLTWQEPVGQSPSDLKAIFYDPTTRTWSAPRQLTNDTETERGLTTAFTGPDTLMAVYNRNIAGQNPRPSDLYMLTYTLGPDLALESGSLIMEPPNALPGQNVTFTVKALNPGDTPTSNIPVAFYNGDPSSGGTLLGQTTLVGVFKPGDTSEVPFGWTIPQSTSPIKIYAVIDPSGTFDPSNRGNNTVSYEIVLPDLAFSAVNYQMPTPTLVSITARVINRGNAPSGPTTISFSFRQDSTTLTSISTKNIPALGIGETVDVNVQWDISSIPRSYYTVYIVADDGNLVTESDETNNTVVLEVLADPSCTYTVWYGVVGNTTITAAPGPSGPYEVNVIPSSPHCTWSVFSDAWLHPNLQAATGNGSVLVVVDGNGSGSQRIGTMTIARQVITVIQDPQTAETITEPTTLTGASSGATGVSYSYSAGGSFSSLGHTVEYQFDWRGDGTELSSWGSFSQSKTWTSTGIYTIKARARCATDNSIVSFWSGTGQTVTITQAGCTYSITPGNRTFNAEGGTGSVNVTTQNGCSWAAIKDSLWVGITSGASGSGSGTMSYSVLQNTGAARTGTIAVADKIFSLAQSGVVDPSCGNLKVIRVDSQASVYSYNSLQAAFTTAVHGDTIKSQALDFLGDLIFSQNASVTLKGGYDCTYSSNPQKSVIDGKLTITHGTVTVENIIIQ